MRDYRQKLRGIRKKFKLMVKKCGSLGVVVCMGVLSGSCGPDVGPIPVLYGPPPVTNQECYTDEDCFAKHGNNWYCDTNEATPVCKCAPVMLYGPQMCTSDEECQTQNGPNWYCDLTNTYDNGCGETASWPLCKQKVCEPVALYGPQPCQSDEQCQSQNGGTNWYCDKTNAFDDGCGGIVTWPICKTTGIAVPLYGCCPV